MSSVKDKVQNAGGPKGPQSVLEHMYKTGEWSDLTVMSREGVFFKVHKSVVCAASPFFHAACESKSGVRETHSNIIELPECWKIVDAILRHFYSLQTYWMEPKAHEHDGMVSLDNAHDLIQLRIVIDKYGIDSMAAIAEKSLSALLFRAAELGDRIFVVLIGRRLFDEPHDFFNSSRDDAARATAKMVPEILRNDCSFETWHGSAEYMQRTLKVREEMRLAELE